MSPITAIFASHHSTNTFKTSLPCKLLRILTPRCLTRSPSSAKNYKNDLILYAFLIKNCFLYFLSQLLLVPVDFFAARVLKEQIHGLTPYSFLGTHPRMYPVVGCETVHQPRSIRNIRAHQHKKFTRLVLGSRPRVMQAGILVTAGPSTEFQLELPEY